MTNPQPKHKPEKSTRGSALERFKTMSVMIRDAES
jgi:hypothetical protein